VKRLFQRVGLLELVAWCLSLLCGIALMAVRVQASSAGRAASQIKAHGAGSGVPAVDSVIARLEISSLGLRVPVVEGFDATALRAGVGHIAGTALPGGLGNMALAGHRDTFLRPLRNIRRGMKMSVFTADGRYDYMVDSIAIVKPEDVTVLAIHDTPEMTLITCYPFDYVGSAPNRFVVRAHLASVLPQ
jgi:sortase A